MTLKEAEKIVHEYGAALGKGTDGIARPVSVLPCSKARIKRAYYVYLEELVKVGQLTEELGFNLTHTYSCIDHFIEDEQAKDINIIHNKIRNKEIDPKDPKYKELFDKYSEFLKETFVSAQRLAYGEINEYIAECYKMYSGN